MARRHFPFAQLICCITLFVSHFLRQLKISVIFMMLALVSESKGIVMHPAETNVVLSIHSLSDRHLFNLFSLSMNILKTYSVEDRNYGYHCN